MSDECRAQRQHAVRIMDPTTGAVRVLSEDEYAAHLRRVRREGQRSVLAHALAAALLLAALSVVAISLARLAERQRVDCGRAEVVAGLGGEPVPAGCREALRR